MWELWELLHWWWELSPNMEMLMWGRRGSIEGKKDSLRTKFTSHIGKSHGLIWACEFFNASAGNCSLPQRLRLVILFCPVTNYSIPGIWNSASSELRVAHTEFRSAGVHDFREMGIHNLTFCFCFESKRPGGSASNSFSTSVTQYWKLVKSIFRGTSFSGESSPWLSALSVGDEWCGWQSNWSWLYICVTRLRLSVCVEGWGLPLRSDSLWDLYRGPRPCLINHLPLQVTHCSRLTDCADKKRFSQQHKKLRKAVLFNLFNLFIA